MVITSRRTDKGDIYLSINTLCVRESRANGTKMTDEVVAVIVCEHDALKHLHGLPIQRVWALELKNHELRRQVTSLGGRSFRLHIGQKYLDRLSNEDEKAVSKCWRDSGTQSSFEQVGEVLLDEFFLGFAVKIRATGTLISRSDRHTLSSGSAMVPSRN